LNFKCCQLNGFLAVAYKDLQIEFRNRYTISITLLFTLISTTIINFSIPTELIQSNLYAGLIWVVIFFASMTGMARSFVSEEEKGTILLLKLISTPYKVFFGKFLFNLLISLLINFASILMFMLFFDKIKIASFHLFVVSIINAGIGIAGCSTIIGAIISKANVKGALFPILSLPILIPLLMLGIEATHFSLIGKDYALILKDNLFMFGYSGFLITLSSFLFEFVWKD
jgi:heme exporter protein B